MEDLQRRAESAENEIKQLMSRIEELRKQTTTVTPANDSEEMEKLKVENDKLKYRINIMKRALTETVEGQFSIIGELKNIFKKSLIKSYPESSDFNIEVVISSQPKYGDYQCNSAMALSKILKESGTKVSPVEVAKTLIGNIPANEIIELLSTAGPGFINITLSQKFVVRQIANMCLEGVSPPKVDKKKVVIDFSSPNIAKEMHVGHLRSTIIGDSLARLLEYLGHDVVRLNHVGDWGTQFGMLLAHLNDKYPDYLNNPLPIGDLQAFYKESKKRFDEDAEFKKRAYAAVVELQAHDPDQTKRWQLICDTSRKEFQKIYDRLDIKLTERGESFYQDSMKRIVEDLKQKNLLVYEEGRYVMFPQKEGLNPLTVVKSDGGYTYDTSDIAALCHRLEVEKADWIIYVTDLGQSSHFESLFDCMEHAGYIDKNRVRIDHVGFGVVLGENKKRLKTRSGDTIRLVDLLDEGIKKSMDKLIEKNRDSVMSPEELEQAKTSVAYGCIKYADLSNNRKGDYIFSFDKMLEDKGNTAVYLLYMYTRIRSIARLANVEPKQLLNYAKNKGIKIEDPKEIKLAKEILKFYDVIQKITDDLLLHSLCEYLYNISTVFSDFYDSCYCVEKDRNTGEVIKVNMDRMLLCEVTANILAKCFDILGLKPVNRM
ncbi:arginine--tRNA ligase, cytoplasmic-like [Artemia franciscana]|uniref:arginine--tRNA ligase, cytoplasmic-like n=1 Tax=Artemia franciscana TaxID=6661 RepID=UPI0032DB3D9F